MSYNQPPNQGFSGGFSGSSATGSGSGVYGQHPGGFYNQSPHQQQFDSRAPVGNQGTSFFLKILFKKTVAL